MLKVTKKAVVFSLLLGALILSACQGGGEQTPTVDPNAIFTAAAITVQAQLTQVAALTPDATETPLPTNTATSPPTMAPGAGTGAGTPGAGVPASGTVFPTFPSLATATQAGGIAGPSAPDKCEFVSQSPDDGTTYDTSVDFDTFWTLKNVGTTTWTKDYIYRYYAGTGGMHQKSSYPFTKDVPPGEQITIIVDMESPRDNGNYQETWVLTNKEGVNFCPVYVEIRVREGTPIPEPDWSDADYETICCDADPDNDDDGIHTCETWEDFNTCP